MQRATEQQQIHSHTHMHRQQNKIKQIERETEKGKFNTKIIRHRGSMYSVNKSMSMASRVLACERVRQLVHVYVYRLCLRKSVWCAFTLARLSH